MYCSGYAAFIFITMDTQEQWKPVVGYEGLYEVSNLGRVRSMFSYYSRGGVCVKILKLTQSYGYLTCGLRKHGVWKNFGVHRLVAEAFLPNPEKYTQINHKNGLKYDNSVDNLEWCTQKQNVRHAISTGLKLTKAQKCEIEKNKKYDIVITNKSSRNKIVFSDEREALKFLGLRSRKGIDFLEEHAKSTIECVVKYEIKLKKTKS